MPPKPRSRSRKKQTRLTFSPAPSSAVPAGSPVSEKRSPAFVRFARPGQINSFYSTDPTARKRKRPENTVSEKTASSDKTGSPLSDSEGSPSRKKGKKAALSVSHSKSVADEALSTADSNASPAPPDMESPMFSRPSSKRRTSVELKQTKGQQKLEKARRAAAKTRSLVMKAKSQQQSDKVAKQQAKLAKREERLEKLRSKLEEQQRRLEEERNKLRQASQAESDSEPGTSDIELPASPQPQSPVTTNSGRPSVVGPSHSNAYLVSLSDSDSDSDDVKPATSNKTKAKQSEDAVDHSEGSEDDIIASSQPQRRRRFGRERSNETPEEPHSEDDVKPHTPRLKRGLMRPQEGSCEESAANTGDEEKDQNQLDLQDDLDFLEDSAVKDTRTRGNVANSAKAKRMAYLDQLRKRRAGVKRQKEESSTSTEEEEEETEDGAQSDSKKTKPEQQHDVSSDDDDDESQPDQFIGEDLDQDDSDFVVTSDPEDTLGAPDSEAVIPLEFSRHRYKKLPEYFRDVVEWMVHNQLNPAFPRDDPVYQMAFDKIDVEAVGRTKSQYISSVWSPRFTHALEARPILESQGFIGEASCDACGRSSHHGRFEIVLKGKPYSLRTLRPLTDGEDEEEEAGEEAEEQDRSEGEEDEHESSESDSQSEDDQGNEDGAEGESDAEDDQEYDRHGNPIPPEGVPFRVGTQCHHNALSAHAMTHWRYELNEWVVGWLEENQILTKKEKRRRKKWSVKLQTDFANQVVDFMVESKEVKRLWKDFRRMGRRGSLDHRLNQVGDVGMND